MKVERSVARSHLTNVVACLVALPELSLTAALVTPHKQVLEQDPTTNGRRSLVVVGMLLVQQVQEVAHASATLPQEYLAWWVL